jgi:hypothetical protein
VTTGFFRDGSVIALPFYSFFAPRFHHPRTRRFRYQQPRKSSGRLPADLAQALTSFASNPNLLPKGRTAVSGLLKKLQTRLGYACAANGDSKSHDPIEILKASFHDLRSLAEQINRHAERAPYPHMARRLRQIAAEKQLAANGLRDKIAGLGEKVEELAVESKRAKNHWERMVQDLRDQRELQTALLERAALVAEEAPEIGNYLREIAAAQLPHQEAFLDLAARADPQAEQS